MIKTISLFFLALLATQGLASPVITKESLRNKLTPSMALVFQSLHKVAADAIKDSQKDEAMGSDSTYFNRWAGRQENVVNDITKDKSVQMVVVPTLEDWSVVNLGGVFGDTESGRLPSIVMMPIVAL